MSGLADELRHLRRGRGVMAADLCERIGPKLRALAGIEAADSLEESRHRLILFLDGLAKVLPQDLSVAFGAGLALDPDLQYRFLEERMSWLAAKLHRDVRTARRRVDEAFKSVDTAAGIDAANTGEYLRSGWYLTRLRTLLRLDGERPEAVEERTLVASDDDLGEIVISTTVPRPVAADRASGRADDAVGEQELSFSVLYGGSLIRCERPSGSYFRYFIGLPHPLSRGEPHDIGVLFSVPAVQPFNPRYTLQPLRRCDEFDLRIRFGSGNRPARIWAIGGLPRGMVDDFADPGALICPDTAGDIRLRYRNLRIGLAYGARWSP
jgi:hypothetical protein